MEQVVLDALQPILQKYCKLIGDECLIAYGLGHNPNKNVNAVKIDKDYEVHIHSILSQLFDMQARSSYFATKRLIKKIDMYKPDIVHLHNLHGCYINIKLLFEYLSSINIPIVWTLHDCWAFTGHCAHFDYAKCDQWKTQCIKCNQKSYPKNIFMHRVRSNYNLKKRLFNNCNNLTIVTPSNWLKSQAEMSFLKKHKIMTINNGIELNRFKPVDSNIKEKYKIQDKFIVLGVASSWTKKKGLNYFIQLSNMLDENYKIVLVGINEKIRKDVPDNILCIPKTSSIEELAQMYSIADVFVNPTLEDTFPTTNLEALACGTPVITFKTGGSPESINETCGIVVKQGDIEQLCNAIKQCKQNNFTKEDCIKQANNFDKQNKFKEYIELYKELLNK